MGNNKAMVTCALCEKKTSTDKACIGFGIEKPVSQSHYFCSEECRNEYVIAETAAQNGINYTIRPIVCNGRTLKYDEGISTEDSLALEKGEVIRCLDEDGSHLMAIYMDPFGNVKEF